MRFPPTPHSTHALRHPGRGPGGGPGGPGGGRGPRGGPGFGPGFGRGFGPDGPPDPGTPEVSASAVSGWLTGRLPDDWFTTAPEVTVDRDEITIVGTLAAPDLAADADDAARAEAAAGRISRFREQSRAVRIQIAQEAEQRYGRKVAWGAAAGDSSQLFTALSVPVMTRLRQPERVVLDTLVSAGVARSRSDALAWCVRLVGRNTEDWLARLREALTSVEAVRADGPAGT